MIGYASHALGMAVEPPHGSAKVFVKLSTPLRREPSLAVPGGEDQVVMQAGVCRWHGCVHGWHPCRGAIHIESTCSGGVASLDHRLQAGKPLASQIQMRSNRSSNSQKRMGKTAATGAVLEPLSFPPNTNSGYLLGCSSLRQTRLYEDQPRRRTAGTASRGCESALISRIRTLTLLPFTLPSDNLRWASCAMRRSTAT